ncbi:MAG TPA: PIN domain-containing protein [Acidobacteriaceae bacterium]
MRRIYWDTMLYAYWLESNSKYGNRVQQIHQTMLQRSDTLCSSLFVLGELLVGPIKANDAAAASAIQQFFDSDQVTMLPHTSQAVRLFAELRANHGVKALDALHLSLAAASGVDLFLTHDRRLHKVVAPGLPFIAGLETDLF